MNIKDFTLKATRYAYRKIAKPSFALPDCIYDRDKSNKEILNLLSDEAPCMISRFGTTEIGIISNYLMVHKKKNILSKCIEYIKGNTGLPWWDVLFLSTMRTYSGIFPETIDTLEKFSERYLKDIPEIDLLGSFNYTERYMPLRKDVINVHLECLYPFWSKTPWTLALKGKKVLVIHPFSHTIQMQYDQRRLLFDNPDILPDYKLITYQAVQSAGGNEVPFKNWFEALSWMEHEISKIDFDICLLGCGAYGLPLAAFIKRMGKKAVHIGGGLQLLFGIKGNRWDNNAYHWKDLPQLNTNYSSLYNQYWTRASQDETPKKAKNVEGACYW